MKENESISTPSTKSPIMIRGIQNITNVSCHITCAIQILCHTILPIKHALIILGQQQQQQDELSQTDSDDVFVNAFPNNKDWLFIHELFDFMGLIKEKKKNPDDNNNDDDNNMNFTFGDRWNPQRLYTYLENQYHHYFDLNNVGDPVTNLINMLRILENIDDNNNNNNNMLLWKSLLQTSIWEGTTKQIIQGRKQILVDNNNTTQHGKNNDEQQHHKQWLQRTKYNTKIKFMSCPLILKISNNNEESSLTTCSLQQALNTYLEPQLVQGSSIYPWDNISPETYIEEIVTKTMTITNDNNDNVNEHTTDHDGNDNNQNDWITTKRIVFECIPRVWLLYVERGSNFQRYLTRMVSQTINDDDDEDDDEINKKISRLEIPTKLDITAFLSTRTHTQYNNNEEEHHQQQQQPNFQRKATLHPNIRCLQGAIIQVIEIDNDDEQEILSYNHHDDEDLLETHCITLLRTDYHSDSQNFEDSIYDESCWCLIDDDNCQVVKRDRAMKMICGTIEVDNYTNQPNQKYTYYGATLLVYSIPYMDNEWTKIINDMQITCNNRDQSSLKHEQSLPTNDTELIGRRLKVKWAKDKWYPGTITNYNPTTGKHVVSYDDGDVKEYILSKKTIDWID